MKKMKKFQCLAICSLALLLATPCMVFSDEENPTEEKEPKVQTGVIASFGQHTKSATVDSVSQSNVPGDVPSPISGRIVHTKRDKCQATVMNNSTKSAYSVSFKIVGTNKRGRKVLQKNYSALLRPKGQVTKNLSCKQGLNMQVVLKSGKKAQ